MSLSCEQCVCVCNGPITFPEEPYRLWCVIECDPVQLYPSTRTVEYVEEVRPK